MKLKNLIKSIVPASFRKIDKSEKKIEEITQIPAEYHSVSYLIDIQPTSKTIEMSKDSKI